MMSLRNQRRFLKKNVNPVIESTPYLLTRGWWARNSVLTVMLIAVTFFNFTLGDVYASGPDNNEDGDQCDYGDCGEGNATSGDVQTAKSNNPVFFSEGNAIESVADLSYSGPDFSWSHTRSYNSTYQKMNSTDELPGVNGLRWSATFVDMHVGKVYQHQRFSPGTDKDYVSVSLSATAKIEFERTGSLGSYTFTPSIASYNGTLTHNSGTKRYTLSLTDTGETYTFYDWSVANSTQGNIISKENRSGAIMTWTYSGNRPATVTFPNGNAVKYVYETLPVNTGRLLKIELVNKSGILDKIMKRVLYTYATDSNLNASEGDLIKVQVDQMNAVGGYEGRIKRTFYTYHKSGNSDGGEHQLKAVYESDAVDRVAAGFTNTSSSVDTVLISNGPGTMDDDNNNSLLDYSSRSFKYYTSDLSTSSVDSAFTTNENFETLYGIGYESRRDETLRVKSETINGSCSSCGGSSSQGITKQYYYLDTDNAYYEAPDRVYNVTIEDTLGSDGLAKYRTVYGTNYDGAILRTAMIVNPNDLSEGIWCTSKLRVASGAAKGQFLEERTAAAHTTVNNATKLHDFLHPTFSGNTNNASNANDASTVNSASGLIYTYEYGSTNKKIAKLVKNGSSGVKHYLSKTVYGSSAAGTSGVPDYLPIEMYTYHGKVLSTEGSTSVHDDNRAKTSYAYKFHGDDNTNGIKRRITTYPIISTAQNGSGVASTSEEYFDKDNNLRWTKDEAGFVNYYDYNPNTGGSAYTIMDAEPSTALDYTAVADTTLGWDDATDGDDTTFARPTRISPTVYTAQKIKSYQYYDDQGRLTKTTDNLGIDTVYKYSTEFNSNTLVHRILVFPAWNITNKLPVKVTEYTADDKILQEYSIKADQASSAYTNYDQSTVTTQDHYLSWTKRHYDEVTGVLNSVDGYHDIPTTGNGTLSTHFYKSIAKYDKLGNLETEIQIVSGTSYISGVEQVTKYTRDGLSRVISVSKGVSDTGMSMGSNYDTLPTLSKIAELTYDDDGVGNSRVTRKIRYHSASDYTGTNFHSDYRGRVRGAEKFYGSAGSDTNFEPYVVMDYNWQGQKVATAGFTAQPTWADVIDGSHEDYASVTTSAGSGYRVSLQTTTYDQLNRSYHIKTYSVDKLDGSADNFHAANFYYDRRSNLVSLLDKYGIAKEYAHDSLNRQYQKRTLTTLPSTKYSSGDYQYQSATPKPLLSEMTGGDDRIITMSHVEFNTKGQATQSYNLEQNHSSVDGIDLSNNDDYISTYTHHYYDTLGRTIATAAYGTNTTGWKYHTAPTYDETVDTPADLTTKFGDPFASPARTDSPDILVNRYEYDTKTGDLKFAQNAKGIQSKSFYDDLGRTTHTVENYYDFAPDTANSTGDGTDHTKDRVTKYVYNAIALLEKTALDTNGDGSATTGDDQTTQYLYGHTIHASLRTNIIYPDSPDTDASGSDQVKLTYNLDGSIATTTDQIGTIKTFNYTNKRQLNYQGVSLGTGVDGSVKSIGYTYKTNGNLENISSYATDNATGTPLNQIRYKRNNYDQLTKSYQAHNGEVSTTGTITPNIEYVYDDAAETSGDPDYTLATKDQYKNGNRLKQVKYAGNSRTIEYRYGAANSLDDRLGRIENIATLSPGTPKQLSSYLYNGTSRMVRATQNPTGIALSYDQNDGDNDYEGFGRFGSVVDQFWAKGGVAKDRFKYTYDRLGNKLTRTDELSGLPSNHKQNTYTVDDLNRITKTILGNGTSWKHYQNEYTYDQLGNRKNYTATYNVDLPSTIKLDHDRDHNKANEIAGANPINTTTGNDWVDPAYDKNGNMTSGPQGARMYEYTGSTGLTFIYDAWNRLVEVKNAAGSSTIAKYEYDGLNRRIEKHTYVGGSLDDVEHYYYNTSWQILEVRKESNLVSHDIKTTAYKQFVYQPYYIDAPLVRFHDANEDGDFDDTNEENYYTHDTQFNVTAITDSSGTVLERYMYDAFGGVWIKDPANHYTRANSSYDQDVLYTGQRYDTETKLYQFRNRYYHPTLGRFINRDPAGYVDGLSLYGGYFAQMGLYDPSGLWVWPWDPRASWDPRDTARVWTDGAATVYDAAGSTASRVKNGVICGASGAVTGSTVGGVTGAVVGSVVAGPGPGTVAGGAAGAVSGSIGGGIGGFINGCMCDPDTPVTDLLKDGVEIGTAAGLTGGVGGVLVGSVAGGAGGVTAGGGGAVVSVAVSSTGAQVAGVAGAAAAVSSMNGNGNGGGSCDDDCPPEDNMSSSNKKGGSGGSGRNKFSDYLKKKYNLNGKQQNEFHDAITGQNYSNEVLEEIAQDIANGFW